jgi:quinoprotein glucose dehydrogenase
MERHLRSRARVISRVAGVVATAGAVRPRPAVRAWPRARRPGRRRPEHPRDWRAYGGDPGGRRFSTLADIDRGNVGRLRRAWTHHTGDVEAVPSVQPAAFECTPLAVDGVLYLSTPTGRVIALDGDTGRALWTFTPPPRPTRAALPRAAHRGVAYWEAPGGRDRRILYGTPDGRLAALDAGTGRLRADFGTGGMVDLRDGVADGWPHAELGVSSPPAVYRDFVITGTHVQEFPALGPAGDVRAYDVRTGALAWRFHTIPRAGEPGADTWEGDSAKDRSGANVWSVISVDAERGLVFLPVGSATYDFYGGDRKGANLFANALVALDAATGERRWHFQTVHHDLWDYDLPAQPVLVDIARDGREVPAVVRVTKSGSSSSSIG